MSQHPNSLWLVSFGDLLTLLLCLFIAQFQINGDVSTVTTSNNNGNINFMPQKEDGTLIANYNIKDFELIVPLRLADFEMRDGISLKNPSSWLQDIDIPQGFAATEMKVSLCSVGFDDSDWQRVNQAAVTVRSQLVDTRFSAALKSYELLGANCKDVIDTTKHIGRIKIVLKKFIKNG